MPYTLPDPIACAMPDDDNSAEWAEQRETALRKLLVYDASLTNFLSVAGEEKLKRIPKEQQVKNAKPNILAIHRNYTGKSYKGRVHILGSEYIGEKSSLSIYEDEIPLLSRVDRQEPEANLIEAQMNLLAMYKEIKGCHQNWQKRIGKETNQTKKKEYCLLARRQIAELIFSVALYEAMNTRIDDINAFTSGFDKSDISYDRHFGKLLYIILKQHFGTEYLPDVANIVEQITGDYETVKWDADPVEFQVQCRTLLCHTKPGEYLSQPGRKDGIQHWQDYFRELNKEENRNKPEIVRSRVSEITHSNFFSVEKDLTLNLVTPVEYEGVGLPQLNPRALQRITSSQSVAKSDGKGLDNTSNPDPSSVVDIEKIGEIVKKEIGEINDKSPSWVMAKANHNLQISNMAEIINGLKKAINYGSD